MKALQARKRWLFAAVVASGVWLCIELAAFVAFRAVDGRFFGFARLRGERQQILGESAPEAAQAQAPRSPIDEQAVHPYVGFVFDPDTAPEHTRLALGLRGKISSWGYNDSAPPFHRRAPDRVIVGIVGGSLARHFVRDFSDRLAQELAGRPRFAGKQITFVRLALDGYKQPQQLLTVSYLLSLGAEFDIVLNIDGFNEVALPSRDNVRQGVYPAFPRAWATRTEQLPDPETRRAMGEVAFLRELRQGLARRFERSPLVFSIAANLVWRAADAQIQTGLARADETLRSHRPERRAYTVTGPPYGAGSEEALYEDLAAIWRGGSLQLDRLCRANGIRYFHFLQPNQYVPGSRTLVGSEQSRAFDAASAYRVAVEAGYPLLRREGEALVGAGVRFRDLTLIYRDVPEQVYRDSCCHLLDLGNEILAGEIAEFIDASFGN